MTEAAAPQHWIPLSAALLTIMAVTAVLAGLRGGIPRSALLARRMLDREPEPDPAGGMRFDPNGPDPLKATAIIRGVPVQRLTARERGFSQQGEDLMVWQQYHYGMRDGVFLEMGALDGWRFSNTLFYEAYLGWTGLLIEPGVPAFKLLTVNRPNATKVNAAVCDREGTVHFVEGVSGLGEIDGIVEFMPDSYKAFWHKNVTQERSTEVPCVPLRKLLAEAGLKHVNLFSLDVEGAELAVLRTIDFTAVTFDVIFVETSGYDPTKDAQCVELLARNGYVTDLVANGSTWFHRQGFSPSRQCGH